jgi:hypothetical protein
MINIITRVDIQDAFAELPADKARLFHFDIDEKTAQRAELIVFVENCRIYVLKVNNWPGGKPMSGAELLKYIATHVS